MIRKIVSLETGSVRFPGGRSIYEVLTSLRYVPDCITVGKLDKKDDTVTITFIDPRSGQVFSGNPHVVVALEAIKKVKELLGAVTGDKGHDEEIQDRYNEGSAYGLLEYVLTPHAFGSDFERKFLYGVLKTLAKPLSSITIGKLDKKKGTVEVRYQVSGNGEFFTGNPDIRKAFDGIMKAQALFNDLNPSENYLDIYMNHIKNKADAILKSLTTDSLNVKINVVESPNPPEPSRDNDNRDKKPYYNDDGDEARRLFME